MNELIDKYDVLIYTSVDCDGYIEPVGGGLVVFTSFLKENPELFSSFSFPEAKANLVELEMLKEGLSKARKCLGKETSLKICLLIRSGHAYNCVADFSYGWKENGWVRSKGQKIRNLELVKEAHFIYDEIKEDVDIKFIEDVVNGGEVKITNETFVQPVKKKKENLTDLKQESVKSFDVLMYTSGACEDFLKPCGSGLAIYAFLLDEKPELFSGFYLSEGTNNVAEMGALKEALDRAKKYLEEEESPLNICLFTKSRYALNCITKWSYGWKENGWVKSKKKKYGGNRKNREIRNLDLIKATHFTYDEIKDYVDIKLIRDNYKDDKNNEGNALANRMAVHAIENKQEELIRFQYDSVKDVLDA